MGCIYSDINGKCDLYHSASMEEDLGVDNNGYCICEDDPDPSISCNNYESLEDDDYDDDEVDW